MLRDWISLSDEAEEAIAWRERGDKFKEILEAVAEVSGKRIEDIKGPRRQKDLYRARQMVMFLAVNECPNLSLPRIGALLGGRHHSTVMHGRDQIAEALTVEVETIDLHRKVLERMRG